MRLHVLAAILSDGPSIWAKHFAGSHVGSATPHAAGASMFCFFSDAHCIKLWYGHAAITLIQTAAVVLVRIGADEAFNLFLLGQIRLEG